MSVQLSRSSSFNQKQQVPSAQNHKRRSSLSWLDDTHQESNPNDSNSALITSPVEKSLSANETNNNNNNISSPVHVAGLAPLPGITANRIARSNSFSFTNQQLQQQQQNPLITTSSSNSMITSPEDEIRLQVQRKLLDQRHLNMRLNKHIKNVKTTLRIKMERVEQQMMEAEDQFAQMSMRNVKYIDDISKFDSPKKSVLGLATTSRRSSLVNIADHHDDNHDKINTHHYHHKHSSQQHIQASSKENHFAVATTSLGKKDEYQPLPRRRSFSSSSSVTPSGSTGATNTINTSHRSAGGSVTFAGIRRFGFAAAAIKSLIEKQDCEHAKEIAKMKQSHVPHQSLAPETHSLLIRNPLQAISQTLRQFHDQTVDWGNEWKRLQDDTAENLAFIFLEEEHHHHGRNHSLVSDTTNNNHNLKKSSTATSILRDPRDDFMKELLHTSQQSRSLLEEQMRRSSDFVQKTLAAIMAEMHHLKIKKEHSGDGEDDFGSSSSLVENSKNTSSAMNAIVTINPSPFNMSAAVLDVAKLAASARRSVAVQVGSIHREDQLEQELDEVRTEYRRLQHEKLSVESTKDHEIASLQENVSRLNNRLELLHSCLLVQKEANSSNNNNNNNRESRNGNSSTNNIRDADLLAISTNSNNNDNQKEIENAMNAIRIEMEKQGHHFSFNTGSTSRADSCTATTNNNSKTNSATASPSPTRFGAFKKVSVISTQMTNNNNKNNNNNAVSSTSSRQETPNDNEETKTFTPDEFNAILNGTTTRNAKNKNATVSSSASSGCTTPSCGSLVFLNPSTPPREQINNISTTTMMMSSNAGGSNAANLVSSAAGVIIMGARAKINSARSSQTVTPVDASSLNTSNVMANQQTTQFQNEVNINKEAAGDTSFSSIASFGNDENLGSGLFIKNINNGTMSKPTPATTLSRTQQHASTPPVKLSKLSSSTTEQGFSLPELSSTSKNPTPINNNNNNNNVHPPLCAKPKSASKRTTSSSSNTVLPASGRGNNINNALAPLTTSSRGPTSDENENINTTNNKTVNTSARKSSLNSTTSGALGVMLPLGQSKQQNSGSNNNNNNNERAPLSKSNSFTESNNMNSSVSVSSSLKRMEEWKDHQSQLWQRRRSQLEKHSAYDGMLKLSTSAGSANLQQETDDNGENNFQNNLVDNTNAATVSPVVVLQQPTSFTTHDVLVDHKNRMVMQQQQLQQQMMSGTFVAKRR